MPELTRQFRVLAGAALVGGGLLAPAPLAAGCYYVTAWANGGGTWYQEWNARYGMGARRHYTPVRCDARMVIGAQEGESLDRAQARYVAHRRAIELQYDVWIRRTWTADYGRFFHGSISAFVFSTVEEAERHRASHVANSRVQGDRQFSDDAFGYDPTGVAASSGPVATGPGTAPRPEASRRRTGTTRNGEYVGTACYFVVAAEPRSGGRAWITGVACDGELGWHLLNANTYRRDAKLNQIERRYLDHLMGEVGGCVARELETRVWFDESAAPLAAERAAQLTALAREGHSAVMRESWAYDARPYGALPCGSRAASTSDGLPPGMGVTLLAFTRLAANSRPEENRYADEELAIFGAGFYAGAGRRSLFLWGAGLGGNARETTRDSLTYRTYWAVGLDAMLRVAGPVSVGPSVARWVTTDHQVDHSSGYDADDVVATTANVRVGVSVVLHLGRVAGLQYRHFPGLQGHGLGIFLHARR